MACEDISDYDYVCAECGESVEATGFFCGFPSGLPEHCAECPSTEFIPRREARENERINHEDAVREDLRLFYASGE